MSSLRTLNKGLEIKIIQLQQKLTEQVAVSNRLSTKCERLETQVKSTKLSRTSSLEHATMQLAQLQVPLMIVTLSLY